MLKGSCLCGSVTYEVHAEPGAILLCHCSKCRKANGSAFAANAPIPLQDFKLVTGKETLAEFESTPGVFRVFCQKCGSPLYSRRPSMPDTIRLRIGSLDSTIKGKPTAHIFVGSKAEWYEINDDLLQYDERP